MYAPLSPGRIRQVIRRITNPLINRIRFGGMPGFSPKSRAEREFDARLSAAPPIFVYQMGKVASTGVYQMLRGSQYPGAVVHAHSFGAYDNSMKVRRLYRYFYESNPKIKIVSLVREPVARNISAFFQNMKRDTGSLIDNGSIDLSRMRRKFLDNYPHEIPLIWFDNNIRKHFQIDVYDSPFPSEGYTTFARNNVELLVMRHDLCNDLKAKLVSGLTGISDLRMSDDNVGSTKSYSSEYAQFKSVKLPLSYLHYLAASQYMKHFFRPEMRQILEYWSEEPLPRRNSA